MILLIFIISLTMPLISYSQESSITSRLSSANQLLLEESNISQGLGFSLAMVTRLDMGMMLDVGALPFEYGLFSVSSLELYLPSPSKTRFLATFRFSTPFSKPDLYNPIYVGLHQQRLGWGIGLSHSFLDQRNQQGRGWMLAFQILTTFDYLFMDKFNWGDYTPITESRTMCRLELGIRINRFVAKHLAFVTGIDVSAGMTRGYQKELIGTVPFHTRYYRGIFTIGVTAGIMF
ncbi:MAG: hypothetical protein ACRCWI_00880 [Brevinema sp.]